MSKVLTDSANYSAIADAIREKNGSSIMYKPSQMADAIIAIPTGGGGNDIIIDVYKIKEFEEHKLGPAIVQLMGKDGTLTLDSSVTDIDAFNNDITDHLFQDLCGSNDQNLVIDLNRVQVTSAFLSAIKGSANYPGSNCTYMFSGLRNTENYGVTFPSWVKELKPNTCGGMFDNCITDTIPEFDTTAMGSSSLVNSYMFQYCMATTIPVSITKAMKSKGSGQRTSYYTFYYSGFYYCVNLRKIESLGVELSTGYDNNFYRTFDECHSLSSFTFEMNDDNSPIEAVWRNQTIDMTKTSSTTYNHDSMVETINSLPDVSGGTSNSIKFKGSYGGNDLTSEEIAVASARGWTVTIS